MKITRPLHETLLLKSTRSTAVTITTYQCKRFKPVSILSTLLPYVTISEKDNPKKKADTILFHNSTKCGVDVLNQMSGCYSVKAACRRWYMHVFYNVLVLALINSWILYKKVTESSISPHYFIQLMSKELAIEFAPSIGRTTLLSPRSDAPIKSQNAGIDPHKSVLLAENQSAEAVQPRDVMTVLEIL